MILALLPDLETMYWGQCNLDDFCLIVRDVRRALSRVPDGLTGLAVADARDFAFQTLGL